MAIRMALAGLGWAGRQHLHSLKQIPDAQVVAIADFDPVRLKAHADPLHARMYRDWDTLLKHERELDAIVLATPAMVRLEPITAICERRLALFCEKPPALDMPTARKAAQLIEQAGIINSVGFQYRWNPLAQFMRDLIGSRRKLWARILFASPILQQVAEGMWPNTLYSKASCGGPMIEQGVHMQDLLRYVTSDEPTSVAAMASLMDVVPTAGRDTEESTVVTVRHASGMLTSHVHIWTYPGILVQLQIGGVGFELTWDVWNHVLAGQVDGQPVQEQVNTDVYAEEMRGFIAAVRSKDQSNIRSDYADAARSLQVCVAANQAIESGLRVEL